MAGRIMELAIAIKGKLDGSVTSSMQRAIQESRQLQTQIRQANQAMRDAQRAADAEQRATGHVSEAQYRHIADLQSRINALTQRRSDILNAQARQEEAQARFDNITGSLKNTVVAGAVLAAPLVAATKAAMDFESAMADVKKVVDFETPEQFKEMNNDILKLSQTLPMAADDIAKIVAAGGQSNIDRADLMSFAESATKMGIAFDVTAEQAGDMMAKWRTAFKMGQDDVVNLADKINYLGNTTAASAPLISDVVTRIGPLGEIGGVASGEIAALGASMVGTGVQSEVAATGIKNLILGMVAGEGATKSQAAAFKKLGLNAVTMAQKMQTDAKGAIMDVFQAIQGLDKYEQATVLADLFGKESIGAISPLLSNLDALEENFSKVADASKYANSMEAEYVARSKTTENQLQLAKNTLMALAIGIGSALLPAVNGLLSSIAPVVSSIATWASDNQELIQTLLAIAAGLFGLVVALKTVFAVQAGWDLLIAKLAAYGVVQEGTTAGALAHAAAMKMQAATTKVVAAAQAAFNAVMSANPIALVVLAITALIGAMVYLYNTNETFRSTVIAAWEEIKSAAMEVWEAIAPIVMAAWEGIKSAAQAGIEFLKGIWASIAPSVMAGVSMIVPIFSGIVNVVKTIIATGFRLWAAYIRTWVSVVGTIIQTVASVVVAVWGAISNAVKTTIAVITAVVNALVPVFSAVWSIIKTVAKVAFIAIAVVALPILATIAAAMLAAGAVIYVTWLGIKAVAMAVWGFIGPYVMAVVDAVVSFLVSAGEVIMGVWETIKTYATEAWAAITTIVSGAAEFIGAFITAAAAVIIACWNSIYNAAVSAWNSIVSTVQSVWSTIQSVVDSGVAAVTEKWERLKSIFSSPIQAVVNFVKGGDSDAASKSGVDVSANAAGGIYNKGAFLTTFAEKSAEAAIPLDGSARALSLWQQAGQMMGAMPSGAAASRSVAMPVSNKKEVRLEYNPTITINGGGGADTEQMVKAALREQYEQFMANLPRMLDGLDANKKRLSMV
ncbi:phage tail tape measure protein [Selenomonas sp. AE3005]|uniref:phage tail tape measure protein n=1 Tax=Selenomonas sp. AE3005 TaxID=1485543 RepID=UPI0025DD8136|nr:phage tail tape measure protein [Selenomonas sp. AE3005]